MTSLKILHSIGPTRRFFSAIPHMLKMLFRKKEIRNIKNTHTKRNANFKTNQYHYVWRNNMKQDIYFKNQFSHCRHMHHYTPSGYVRIVTTFHSGSPSISSDHSVFTIWFFSSALCRRLGHRGKVKLAALTLATAAAWCHDWFIHLGPLRAQGTRKRYEHPAYTPPKGYGTLYLTV